MSDAVEVAIVGAGPYGLSLAAHLRAANVQFRHFGLPMRLWQAAMPQGMYLKSQGFASNLSDPAGTHTLENFCKATGRGYASYGRPVPLDTFVAYGRWFASEHAQDLEETLVTSIARRAGEFELTLVGSEIVRARRVVVAAGVEHFAYLPEPLSALPSSACTHSSAHADLGALSGQEVIVVGAGQSALESAALLHENGADVRLVARRSSLSWNGEPLAPDRPLRQRLAEPEAGLGSGWNTWFYSNHPDLFRHLPRATRVRRARTALGPAGACWLRSRVEGQFPIHTGQAVRAARQQGGGVQLDLTAADGSRSQLTADHVIAATGYRADLTRLPFLGTELLADIRTLAGSSVVGPDYQSSVRGLYFIGPAVAPTFGPVMRFVYGSRHAATAVAARLASSAGGMRRATAAAGR
ncbi:MAG TPA: NAD(P)-binding domain-containing protein [Streptosporangiaceae bacterium]|nr:NAD(P)-binding domain-containing protein [Streptosporangiaceae bacterium]